MSRPVVYATAAVAALLAASLATVAFVTRPSQEPVMAIGDETVVPAPSAPTRALPPPAPAAEPTLARPAPSPAAKPPEPSVSVRRASAVPFSGEWEAIPPTNARRLPVLERALKAARPRLAPCFDEEVQARYGRRAYSAPSETTSGPGNPIFLLQMEVQAGGGLRIVDAPVESRGAADDGLLACAQEALRGLALGSSTLEAGQRLRVRYPLPAMTSSAPFTTQRAPRVRLRPH